jgi:hypothetical protein
MPTSLAKYHHVKPLQPNSPMTRHQATEIPASLLLISMWFLRKTFLLHIAAKNRICCFRKTKRPRPSHWPHGGWERPIACLASIPTTLSLPCWRNNPHRESRIGETQVEFCHSFGRRRSETETEVRCVPWGWLRYEHVRPDGNGDGEACGRTWQLTLVQVWDWCRQLLDVTDRFIFGRWAWDF